MPGAWAAAIVLLCARTLAYAQPAPSVELQLPSCLDPSFRDQLIDSARIELHEDGLTLAAPSGEHSAPLRIAIELRCDLLGGARISLAVPRHASPTRAVQLSDVPQHLRPRTLALALAELLRSTNPPPPSPAPTSLANHSKAAREPLAPRLTSVPEKRSHARQPLQPDATSILSALPASAAGSLGVAAPTAAAASVSAGAASVTQGPPPLAAAPSVLPGGEKPGEPQRAAESAVAQPVAAVARAAEADRVDGVEAREAGLREQRAGAPALSLTAALRAYLAARDVLPGVQLAFSWRGWRIGGEGFYGSHAELLGSARFGLVQGFLSWELARLQLGAYGLALAPRAAVGGILASASAQPPAYASSLTVIAWDASAEATFWRTLGERWRLALRVQLGYAHGALLTSDAGDLAHLHGPFASAGLALELQLGDS